MKLIIFSGLPGTGKSTLAEAVGRALEVPVFAKDWLEATLLRSGIRPTHKDKSLGFASYELLTVLAERQLILGQSVILDSVAATKTIRSAWYQLAEKYQANCRIIECVCSDELFHRSQLKQRQRNIPGWHELDWSEVERVKQYYSPWEEEHLVLDMTHSFDENFLKAKIYCE
jgi:predicted kinase